MTHTYGPWRYWLTTNKRSVEVANDTETICELHRLHNPNYADDACFIVTACNAHDALLEICKAFVELYGNNSTSDNPDQLVEMARDAIARAEGQP